MCSLHVNKIKINPGLLLSVQSRKPVHVPCVRSPWMGEVVFDVPDHPWHVGESIMWKVVPDKEGHLWQGRSSSTWKVIPDKESHPWHGRSSLIRKVILDMEGHSWLERSSLTWKVIPDKEGNPWHVRSSLGPFYFLPCEGKCGFFLWDILSVPTMCLLFPAEEHRSPGLCWVYISGITNQGLLSGSSMEEQWQLVSADDQWQCPQLMMIDSVISWRSSSTVCLALRTLRRSSAE